MVRGQWGKIEETQAFSCNSSNQNPKLELNHSFGVKARVRERERERLLEEQWSRARMGGSIRTVWSAEL